MTALLEIKQNIKRFYGQYEVYILPSGFRDDVSGICVDDRALLCSRDRNGRIYATSYSVNADPVPKIQQVTESCNDPYTTFLRIWCSCTYADRSRPAG